MHPPEALASSIAAIICILNYAGRHYPKASRTFQEAPKLKKLPPKMGVIPADLVFVGG